MSSSLQPLESLFDQTQGQALPEPPELLTLYGPLQFPLHPGQPYLVGNFVSTLDGVVSLNIPGQAGGGPISGESPHDHLVMGLLRSVADAVIIGAGTLRAVSPEHRWTAQYIYPALGDVYQQLRLRLGKPEPPLNVVVTARGDLNLALPLFQSGDVPVMIVTTTQGATYLSARLIPPAVRVVDMQPTGPLRARSIVRAVCEARPCQMILVEGGPQVLGDFLTEHLLDELFLTLAPQIAGRDNTSFRPGLVEGHLFAPEHPLWGTLISVKRGGSHLFVRYAFQTQEVAS
ncbi:RibD family protein [Dictyobacter aurantiacus]|uniref:Deaminase reductase n=1 Tax=Dictyobacter aurantiacus TaxID=1936993 RepID=A0A401ZM77_9CHLR|nr:dihydrofolate reductase family protein [Dictyobacter aurantiacus]GCE07932.1 deaminase reductase [Dictyobacter aurantiacus]